MKRVRQLKIKCACARVRACICVSVYVHACVHAVCTCAHVACVLTAPQSLRLLPKPEATWLSNLKCLCHPFTAVSSLTSLHLQVTIQSDECLRTILHNNRSTLTELNLRAPPDRILKRLEGLLTASLPRLRRLAVSDLFSPADFIIAHSNQLTRLQYLHTHSTLATLLAGRTLPHVTDLHLDYVPSLMDLERAFPRLCNLRLRIAHWSSYIHAGRERDSAVGLAPYLVSLHCETLPTDFVACTRLHTLSVRNRLTLPGLSPLLPQLTALACATSDPADLADATNLRVLYLSVPHLTPLACAAPMLRTLCVFVATDSGFPESQEDPEERSIRFRPTSAADLPAATPAAQRRLARMAEFFASVERLCPMLEVFGLAMPRALGPLELDALRKYLRGAFSRGLMRFVCFALAANPTGEEGVRVSVADHFRTLPDLHWLALKEIGDVDTQVPDLEANDIYLD